MQFLYKNIAVIHVFAVCATFAWLFGGVRPGWTVPVMPWVTALLLEALVCFPQQHENEPMYDARERVWRGMRKDPLVWLSLAFVLLLAIPFLNTGLCRICDYPEIQAGADSSPTIPFLPFCVNRKDHLDVVMWFVPSLAAMVAAKHALLKRGKRTLLAMIVWNGLALGIVGALQQMTRATGPLWTTDFMKGVYFFSTFGYPNMAGDYFTTLFGLAVAMWRWNVDEVRRKAEERDAAELAEERRAHAERMRERVARADAEVAAEAAPAVEEGTAAECPPVRREDSNGDSGHRRHRRAHLFARRSSGVSFWEKHYYLIPAVIFFFCTLDTLSRAAILSVTTLAILFFFHSVMCFFKRMKRVQRVKSAIVSAIVLSLITVCAVVFMPKDVQSEVNTVDTIEALDRITGKGQYHVRVATAIWKDHFLFGVGGWGYKHFNVQYMTDKELRKLQKFGGANVHNDYLQFLVEHGAVGLALLAAMVFLLVRPVFRAWKVLIESVWFVSSKDQPPMPVQIFALPAPVFCILLTAVSTFIHAFGDCPLRSPAVLSLFLVSLAAADGFLPKFVSNKK